MSYAVQKAMFSGAAAAYPNQDLLARSCYAVLTVMYPKTSVHSPRSPTAQNAFFLYTRMQADPARGSWKMHSSEAARRLPDVAKAELLVGPRTKCM